LLRAAEIKDNDPAGHLAALLTILIWGTTFVSTKILLQAFTPIEILFFRFIIGLLALILIYPRRLKVRLKSQELVFAAAGLAGVTLYYLLENVALSYSLASNVGVIICIAPFFTAILAQLFLEGEPLSTNFFLGFIVAISGICLISFSGTATFELNPLGDLLAVLAAFAWAVYSILTRKIAGFGYNAIQTTRRVFSYGLLFMLPTLFFFPFDWELTRLANPIYLFNILFLGLGASALCFVTWSFSVKILGAVKSSIYIYMVPVITVVTSVIVLHEKITGVAALGILLTLVGLVVSESKVRLKQKI